jgi:hypothetical protein
MAVVTDWLGSRPGQVVGFAILAFLNIHNYAAIIPHACPV